MKVAALPMLLLITCSLDLKINEMPYTVNQPFRKKGTKSLEQGRDQGGRFLFIFLLDR